MLDSGRRTGRRGPCSRTQGVDSHMKAIIDIESLTILYGELTPRVLGLVV
jgi:hypothetical protein